MVNIPFNLVFVTKWLRVLVELSHIRYAHRLRTVVPLKVGKIGAVDGIAMQVTAHLLLVADVSFSEACGYRVRG